MTPEKGFQSCLVPFPDFAEHPSDSFMDQILPIRQKPFSDPERISKVVLADEVVRRDNADPPFPEAL